MNKIYLIIILSILLLLSGCQNSLTDPNEKNNPVIATGTCQVDFQLALELEKLNFEYGESTFIKVYFKNVGSNIMTLDGILPYRNSSNPPRVIIWSTDGLLRFQIHEILPTLLNEDKIIVDIGKSVMLMNFNLTEVGGFQLQEDEFGVVYSTTELEKVYSSFSKGNYKICADFWPIPPVAYNCVTETLQFTIK